MKGYTHIYTGDGKGKTTAALGLILRASGAGKRIFFAQFMKKGNFSEIKILKERFPEVTVKQYGTGKFCIGEPSARDKEMANRGLNDIAAAFEKQEYDMIIADELNTTVLTGVIGEEEVLNLLDIKPKNIEFVITGRGKTNPLIKKADLVTEMRNIKHYFSQGQTARKGIEY
jgi:cob(I)alamin adenosyltransferase